MVEVGSAGVGAVVLAAGSSSRMGTPKQLLRYRGRTLLRRAAAAALGAGCRPVVVVTGAAAERTSAELRGLDVREALNERWAAGMGSSVSKGVGTLVEAEPGATAVVLLLCDQPCVTPAVVAGLIAAHRATGRQIVASEYGGGFGVPALFGRPFFEELLRLGGEGGAKQVVRRHLSETYFVPLPGGEIDVDTPEDFSRLASTPAGESYEVGADN